MSLPPETGPAPLILIVDDVPEDRQVFRRYLTRDCNPPYRLAEAHNLMRALELAKSEHPDCLLLDYNLTDGNGLDLLRRLVAQHGAHAFGIIMLTGSGEASIAVEAMKCGAHDYVEKHVLTAGGLRRAVTNAIEKAAIQRQLAAQTRELAVKNEELATHVTNLQHEVVERTRAQEALTQSEAFLQSVIGANTDCVKVLNLDGHISWMNENGKVMMEITDFTDICDRPWTDLWPEGEMRREVQKAFAAALAGRIGRFSGACPTAKGTAKWWDVIVTPIFGAGRKPEKILSVSRDITKARQAEKAVHETAAQLRAITAHLPLNVAQIDRHLRFRFANEHLSRRFGFTPEEMVGKELASVIGPTQFAQLQGYIERTLVGERINFEMTVKIEGQDFWYRVNYIPERDGAGEVIGFIGVSTDITERKKSEIEIARARDEAVDAAKARDNFLAALSHELRTPLNPVLLVASEAAENPGLPPAVRDDFSAIRDHVELEARLIDDLLDLSRISHGKLKLDRRRLGLHSTLQNAISTVEPEIEAKEIKLKVTLAPEEPVVNADSVRLQQVIWNVLKNAVKFTPAGGKIFLETSVDAARRLTRIRISDSGIGLTPGELPRIFDAFSQGDHAQSGAPQRFGGLGLGLAITRMLVEAHEGKIAAESAGPNQGSTFTIELPLAQPITSAHASNGHHPSNGKSEPAPAARVNGQRGRVLLIEDHASTRASLSAVLGRRGYQVVAAATVAEAQSLARQHELDMVISDIGLPDGDGYSCMQQLQKIRPGLAGIALSGYGMEEDLAKSRQVGFTEHLIKPVNVQALDHAMARALHKR